MKLGALIADGLSVAAVSAGSASILLIGSVALPAAEFVNLGLVATVQAVLGLLLRAAFAEPLVQHVGTDVPAQLVRQGGISAVAAAVVLLCVGLFWLDIPLVYCVATAAWTPCWFGLEAVRCWSASTSTSLFGSTLTAIIISLFISATVLTACGMTTEGMWFWAAGYIAGLVSVTAGLLGANRQWQIVGLSPAGHAAIGSSEIWDRFQKRFLVDAIFLQIAVQGAILLAGLFASAEIAAAMRLSQIIYFPLMMATLVSQTRTTVRLSRVSRAADRSGRTAAEWLAPLALVALPLMAATPPAIALAKVYLPPNYDAFLSVLPLIAFTKVFDLIQNVGVSVLRGRGYLRRSSRQRRVWGVASAGVIVATIPLASLTATFLGMLLASLVCAVGLLVEFAIFNRSKLQGGLVG